jgi:hypothetical protein
MGLRPSVVTPPVANSATRSGRSGLRIPELVLGMKVAVDEQHLGRSAQRGVHRAGRGRSHAAQTQATSSGATSGLPAKAFRRRRAERRHPLIVQTCIQTLTGLRLMPPSSVCARPARAAEPSVSRIVTLPQPPACDILDSDGPVKTTGKEGHKLNQRTGTCRIGGDLLVGAAARLWRPPRALIAHPRVRGAADAPLPPHQPRSQQPDHQTPKVEAFQLR